MSSPEQVSVQRKKKKSRHFKECVSMAIVVKTTQYIEHATIVTVVINHSFNSTSAQYDESLPSDDISLRTISIHNIDVTSN
jgi:hypothetical protein